MSYEIPPGKRGRIVGADPASGQYTIELQDGSVGTLSHSGSKVYELGTTVILHEDDYGDLKVYEVPNVLVPKVTSVGVVKHSAPDAIIVDVDGRLRDVESQLPTVRKGSTVEVDPVCGIIREILPTPIRILDLGDESSRVSDFIVKKGDSEQSLRYQDFAGFPDIVEEARELIEISLDPQNRLMKIGGRPIKGLLFTGSPGSGKTLLARIISEEVGATFYQINGPAVMGRWVGQSEQVLRSLFDHAAEHRPAIIFFDEIDSLATRRDLDASEASQRVVAQLLTLMDGFHALDRLLVVAATNRIDQIDPALRRPGRFDREIHFRSPDYSDRLSILELGENRFAYGEELAHERMAHRTEGWSSAEVSAIWNEAAFLAVSDGREFIRAEDYLGGFERQQRLRDAREGLGAK